MLGLIENETKVRVLKGTCLLKFHSWPENEFHCGGILTVLVRFLLCAPQPHWKRTDLHRSVHNSDAHATQYAVGHEVQADSLGG